MRCKSLVEYMLNMFVSPAPTITALKRGVCVSVQAVTSDMAASLGLKHVGGLIVGSVMPGSAADRAGLKRDDVIQSFNGQPVNDANSLRNRVADTPPGSKVTLVAVRDGSERSFTVTLDDAAAGKRVERAERADEPGAGVRPLHLDPAPAPDPASTMPSRSVTSSQAHAGPPRGR